MKPSISDPSEQHSYSSVAILLHWLLALTLAFQLALGFAMPKDESGFAEYQLHKSVGIVILLLTLLRLAWRLLRRPPPPMEGGFNGFLAKTVHAGFYAVLILAPLTGWALVSTASIEVPTVLFGTVPLPHLPLPAGIHEASEVMHELLSWIVIGLFLLHVAGALRHHLIVRDALLERMAPGGSAVLAGALGALVVALGVATLLLARDFVPASGSVDESVEAESPMLGSEIGEKDADEPKLQRSEEENADAAEEGGIAAVEAPATGRSPIWSIQPGGRLGFSISNGDDIVRGSFAQWSGSIRFDPDHPANANIRIEVDLASASVGDATMDGMLRGAEFLAAANNPEATWRADSVRQTGDGRYSAEGTLSLRGVSRPQALAFTLSGEDLRRRVEGSATIDRTTFDIGTRSAAESLGQTVSLNFSFEAVGQKP